MSYPSDCGRCQKSRCWKEDSFRLLVKNSVNTRPIFLHVHFGETLRDILKSLCRLHPDQWQTGALYYVYGEDGGRYFLIEDPSWLRDKDLIIVTTTASLQALPSVSFNAVHAMFKPSTKLKAHQIEGVKKMVEMENEFKGGVLADEMGLGKTIQALALISRQQPLHSIHACTLVLAPTTGIVDTWAQEIRTKTEYGSIPYFVFHDDADASLLNQTIFHIVITTYSKVRAEYKKNAPNVTRNSHDSLENSSLFAINWNRIIIDESHTIGGKGTMLFRAVVCLKSEFKWCLTGTPIQNNSNDLYQIFSFLGIQWDKKMARKDDEYLPNILKEHMIRRKNSELGIALELTTRKDIRITLDFTEPERQLYNFIERMFYQHIKKWRQSGYECGTSFVSSLILYLRLKQTCGHHKVLLDKFPDLIPSATAQREDGDEILLRNFKRTDIPRETAYYDEETEFQEIADVIRSFYDQFGVMQEPINVSELNKLKVTQYSSKIIWLLNFFKQLFKENSTDKVVVMSQFVELIDKVVEALTNARIKHKAYHGGMNRYVKQSSLDAFNNDDSTRIIVMSLKTGGIGLNLQKANHMVFPDRWWNPASMNQATARIRRMNQLKETFIYTVVIKDTIEETLMDTILDKKKRVFDKVVDSCSNRK